MDNKELIIKTAVSLFAKYGFKSTPLTKICEACGISKGLILYHFESKNNLLREIFMYSTRIMTDMNVSVTHEDTLQGKLGTLLEAFFDQLTINKELLKLNVTLMMQPDTSEILQDLITERSTMLLESVREIFAVDNAEEALVNSHLFIAELDGLALHYFMVFEDYPLEDIKKQIIKKYTKK